MKKTYLLISMILFIGTICAQPCLTQPNNISTDPNNPVNSECNGLMLNTFDWRNQVYPINYIDYPQLTTIQSPFYNSSNGPINYLWNTSVFGPHDYHPEDGWEFIKSGFAPDVTDYSYIVLYNKYTSVIRVLTSMAPTQEDYQVIKVTLFFQEALGSYPTASLHPQRQLNQALDQPSIPSVSSTVQFPSTPTHFFHVDFPVEYDACSCNLKSSLNINYEKIDVQTLDLYGRMVTINQSLANIQASGSPFLEDDFLTSVYTEGSSTKAGAHTFKTWQGIINQYTKLQQQKAAYTKQLEEFKQLEQALKLATGPGKSFLDGLKVIKDLPVVGGKLTALQVVNAVSSGVNYLSAPIKAKINTTNNSIQLLGTIQLSQSEIALTGNLTTVLEDSRSISFQNPGSSDNAQVCDVDQYPSYNETMGRFAVLTTPKSINGKKKYYTLWSEGGGHDPAQTSGDPFYEYEYFNAEYTTKFDGNLDYLYNKAADINLGKTELWGAIQVKVFLPYMDRNVMISNMEEVLVSDDGSQTALYQSPLMPISCLSNFVGHIKALRALDRSPLASDPGIHALDIIVLEERLKLVNFYEFNKMNSEGAPASALQVLTYKLEPEQVNSFQTPTTDYPENLEIGPETYTSNTTIYAWGNITIKGDILTANQTVNVTIIGGSITVEGDSKIGKRITLKVAESPFANCTPIDEYSQSLSAYCSSNSYKGSSVATRLGNPNERKDQELNSIKDNKKLTANLYPNPTNGEITRLTIKSPTVNSNFEVSILQPTGGIEEVIHRASILEEGESTFNINTNKFTPGLYFVKIKYSNEVKVLKLIIR